MSKIEQIIMDLEDYIEGCKLSPLSNSKISVNKNEIEEMIDDLKANIPDEVKKYQRIIANRDAILKDAQDKAEEMIRKANEMTVQLVSEHEIMQKAYAEADDLLKQTRNEAQRLVDDARGEANSLKSAANNYLDSSMADIQDILVSTINGLSSYTTEILNALQTNLNIVVKNREAYAATQRHIDMENSEYAERNVYQDTYQEPVYQEEPAYQEERPLSSYEGDINENYTLEDAYSEVGYDEEADGGIDLM